MKPYIFSMLLLAACQTNQKPEIAHELQQDSLIRALTRKSLKTDTVVFMMASKVVEHDSLINERQWKRDRAERRGKFWGGVAKVFVK